MTYRGWINAASFSKTLAQSKWRPSILATVLFNSYQCDAMPAVDRAALAGFGLAYVPEDLVRPHLAKGRLRRVLEDWCPLYAGYHLYYPSRRQPPAALRSWSRRSAIGSD
jgi:DNA-binding transcriptional LysR family regulator